MKILYFYQYFSTPKGSWGTRVYENTRRWVKMGHEVTVVTSVFYKSDLKKEKGKLVYNLNCEGINVKVINILSTNKDTRFKRIKGFLMYMIIALWYALTYPCEVVISSSGPLTVGIPGLVAKHLRRKKLVFEVRDLWPEGAIQLGILTNKITIRFSYWLEKQCYKASSLIVTLSPGMISYIKQKVPNANIVSIPNACDIEDFSNTPQIKLPELTNNKFIAIYTGNIGETNNTKLLFRAAEQLQKEGNENILFVIVGEGQLKEELLEMKKNKKLNNFMILDLMPKKDLVPWILKADVCLVPLADRPFIDTSSPNKLFEAFAAGKCVIQTTTGWIKDILDSTKCGFTVSPNNELELVTCLRNLATNFTLTIEAGRNGKKMAEIFERQLLANEMIKNIYSISNENKN